MNRVTIFRLIACLSVAALMALTTHIVASGWTKPLIAALAEGFNPKAAGGYTATVMFASYATAFISVAVLMLVYYHAGHVLAVRSRALKVLAVAAIILEVKGELIRKPVMDYVYNQSIDFPAPLYFVLLNQADVWAANLIVALCLVYICPQKQA